VLELSGPVGADQGLRRCGSKSHFRPSAVARGRQPPGMLRIIASILEQPLKEKIVTHLRLQAQ
jgi:hypothetical protein